MKIREYQLLVVLLSRRVEIDGLENDLILLSNVREGIDESSRYSHQCVTESLELVNPFVNFKGDSIYISQLTAYNTYTKSVAHRLLCDPQSVGQCTMDK